MIFLNKLKKIKTVWSENYSICHNLSLFRINKNLCAFVSAIHL